MQILVHDTLENKVFAYFSMLHWSSSFGPLSQQGNVNVPFKDSIPSQKLLNEKVTSRKISHPLSRDQEVSENFLLLTLWGLLNLLWRMRHWTWGRLAAFQVQSLFSCKTFQTIFSGICFSMFLDSLKLQTCKIDFCFLFADFKHLVFLIVSIEWLFCTTQFCVFMFVEGQWTWHPYFHWRSAHGQTVNPCYWEIQL